MPGNVISWNVENWITIILMAAIGFALLGLGIRFMKGRSSGSDSE